MRLPRNPLPVILVFLSRSGSAATTPPRTSTCC